MCIFVSCEILLRSAFLLLIILIDWKSLKNYRFLPFLQYLLPEPLFPGIMLILPHFQADDFSQKFLVPNLSIIMITLII